MPSRETDVRALVPDEYRRSIRRRAQPRWIEPMLATLTESYFSDPQWVFEPKLDGVRCIAYKKDNEVRLMSRNQLSLNDRYPEVVEAVSKLKLDDVVLDGEVAVVSHGIARFQSLQRHLLEGGGALVYFVFDAPHVAGYDVTKLPATARKALLKKVVKPTKTIELVDYRVEHGEAFLEEACAQNWEGLIAKRAAAPYVGGRSKEWLKFKCSKEQELVVGGYTDPQGARVGFGALLVGYYDDGELHYGGKVGTGYNTPLLLELARKLQKLERTESPFEGKPPMRKGVHWVEPTLVAQVGFAEWTRDGRLRHPRFLGLRDDKNAADVVRETS
ncbi:MAG TPA: non-homologous end-joining DNA ligase [Actinomycetota bacterium]